MNKEEFFKEAADSIVQHDINRAQKIAETGLAAGIDPIEFISKGFRVGITEIGDLFSRGEIFMPELIEAANAMKASNDILTAALPEGTQKKNGVIVIGTVQGDIHDIGKMLVVSMLQVNGFEVHDLGHDVEIKKFIDKAQEVEADIIGTSALLTTTMVGQRALEEELKKSALSQKFKTMVGGAPVTQRWADRIGADAYAEDAVEAVKKALELVGMA